MGSVDSRHGQSLRLRHRGGRHHRHAPPAKRCLLQRVVRGDGQDDSVGVQWEVRRTRTVRDDLVVEPAGRASCRERRRDKRGVCAQECGRVEHRGGRARGTAAGAAFMQDMMAMKHPELCAGNKTFTREGKAIMLPRGDSSLKEYVDFWLRENAGRMEASFHKWMNLTVSG
mmetsp:Transcript_29299/g.94098  ORF Transcript_29299/g.94098 Transcript_29299/m.94098 type:complete len:171 (+) Transcript_29299:821-1333(+)